MIKTEQLTKIYRTPRKKGFWQTEWQEKTAVQGLNLQIPEGRITGLLGINGAGKSTTIKMLSTLLLPTSGGGSVDGYDLATEPEKVRPLINLITGGERALYWRLTGRENLWYFGQLYDIEGKRLKERIEALLQRVGLLEAADTPVERYSKGMKQRLQIARGLLNAPKYLFMDEPTLGLDAPIARQLRRMTRDLADQHGCGILLTSHYMFEVEELCDYLYVIDRGEMVAEGSPTAIKERVRVDRKARVVTQIRTAPDELERWVRSRLPQARFVSVELLEEGIGVTVQAVEDLTSILVELLSSQGGRILRAESLDPSLEDAIVALAERSEVPA
jgi:ABC-2 type transport system ATP-binding protein